MAIPTPKDDMKDDKKVFYLQEELVGSKGTGTEDSISNDELRKYLESGPKRLVEIVDFGHYTPYSARIALKEVDAVAYGSGAGAKWGLPKKIPVTEPNMRSQAPTDLGGINSTLLREMRYSNVKEARRRPR